MKGKGKNNGEGAKIWKGKHMQQRKSNNKKGDKKKKEEDGWNDRKRNKESMSKIEGWLKF